MDWYRVQDGSWGKDRDQTTHGFMDHKKHKRDMNKLMFLKYYFGDVQERIDTYLSKRTKTQQMNISFASHLLSTMCMDMIEKRFCQKAFYSSKSTKLRCLWTNENK
jgi:hypothetical protein